jgi:hypothetical protein
MKRRGQAHTHIHTHKYTHTDEEQIEPRHSHTHTHTDLRATRECMHADTRLLLHSHPHLHRTCGRSVSCSAPHVCYACNYHAFLRFFVSRNVGRPTEMMLDGIHQEFNGLLGCGSLGYTFTHPTRAWCQLVSQLNSVLLSVSPRHQAFACIPTQSVSLTVAICR